jgi:hypothetical protein
MALLFHNEKHSIRLRMSEPPMGSPSDGEPG